MKDNLIIELYSCKKEKRFEIVKKIENLVGAINEDKFLLGILRERN